MKKIIFIIFYFLFFSCNTGNKNSIKWTDEEKDDVFKNCITFAMEVDKMDAEQANRYCYCTLDILIKNFENKQIAEEHLLKDPSLRVTWYENCK